MQLKHPNPCYPGGNTKPYDHPRVDVNPTNETTCDLTQNGTNEREPELQHANRNNKDNGALGCVGPVDESNDDSSSENGDNSGRDPDPRGRNGNSSDDDYKEDPFDLWALRQRQLNNRDPKFESNPWLPDGDSRISEHPSWLPAHTNEKLQECATCGKWAYRSRCKCIRLLLYQTPMKLRYQEQMSHKMSPGKLVTQMPKRIFLVNNDKNIDTPHNRNRIP